MRWMMRQTLCRWFHHRWLSPVSVTFAIPDITVFRTQCDRCHEVVIGDWEAMESIGAWPHWRRSL